MAGVGGVGSSGNTQEAQSQNKLDDVKAQNRLSDRLDQAALDAQLNQQAKRPSSEAMTAFIAQLQAQQAGRNQQPGGNPLDNMSPEVRAQARAISAQVVNQMLSMMPSAQTAAAGGASGSGTDEQGGNAGAGPSGLGSVTSAQESDVDKRLAAAAKVAVYDDIYKLLNKMQSTRDAKAKIDEHVSSINLALAGKKSGDKVKVPVYELDIDSGQVKFKGYKEMSYDEAVVMRDKLTDAKDAMNELNQEDMFWLQRLMEQKSQLETMISNTMKASSDTQGQITNNLKA